MRATSIVLIAALAPASMCRAAAPADEYPNKAVRMLVISSAAGSTDIIARMTAKALSEGLRQQVVLDNRPGGGGIIASEILVGARPDGYTILMSNTSHSVQPHLHAKLPYDPVKDFAPISLVAVTHSLLTVNPAVPAATVKELIAHAKAQPGKMNYASGTNGSSAHIGMELFKLMAGVNIVRVPYKGTAENVNALISGEVHAAFITLPAALPHVTSGRLRALAIGGPRSTPRLPDLPPVADTLPGFDIGTWTGILAPARTPPRIVARLNSEIRKMSENEPARELAASQGASLTSNTPEAFAAYIREQIERFGKVARATGLRAN
jgi:tripartite-type tricarboxylate transporter receptor subunit TctC